jgi:DNA recombination protein RmuC
VDSFNSAVGSIERNVLPQARKFTELKASTDTPIEPVDPIEKAVRSLATAPALEADDSTDTTRTPS